MKENRVPGSQEDPHFWISVVLIIVQPANPRKRREGEKGQRRRALRKFPSKNQTKDKKPNRFPEAGHRIRAQF